VLCSGLNRLDRARLDFNQKTQRMKAFVMRSFLDSLSMELQKMSGQKVKTTRRERVSLRLEHVSKNAAIGGFLMCSYHVVCMHFDALTARLFDSDTITTDRRT
jgi:hypothetical protein